MSEFFIYFRCWPGFKDELPKRFNSIIDDGELDPEKQKAAIAAIKKLGGKVTFDKKNPGKPISVILNGAKVIDAGLVHLKGLTKLKTLSLINTKVADAGVKDLQAALPKCIIYK